MTTWVYFLDNTSTVLRIDNQPLFALVNDLAISEDCIFVDDAVGEPVELRKLLATIQPDDILVVRSLGDLAGEDGSRGMAEVLQELDQRGVELISVLEPWYQRGRSSERVARVVDITAELAERKRRVGMEQAKRQGRMGRRQASQGNREQIEKLRAAGFSVKETCQLCGVSRSTYYRRMGQQNFEEKPA